MYSTCKIEEINSQLFTILIYAFAKLYDNGTVKPLDEWGDIKKEGYLRFNALKQKNPQLRTLLSIGGGSSDASNTFSLMAMTEDSRRLFIDSSLKFITKYGFDGIDIDWEYPTKKGGKPEDRKNLSLLLKEMRIEFDKYGYILTMAVISGASSIDPIYEVSQLSRYLHLIHLMTYDMHSFTQGKTGHNAPLHSNDTINVEYSAKAWISKGAISKKIILGVGAYGKSFTLSDPKSHGIGAPTLGPGMAGPYSRSNGTLYYYEVLEFQKNDWMRVWSKEQQVPYSYRNDQWVGYDDVESIEKKVVLASKLKLGGMMMWSVDMDDPRGIAGEKFPLAKAMSKKILSLSHKWF
ncbi:hypothetical protein FQA39_LY18116 [Lamprigera yunnana]|nr:hypothetical protein FQA39_LY18116 [Lamprigera yunnana]